MLNCHQATLLIERTASQPVRCGTLLPLRVHLRLCYLCRRYRQQTELIARVARASGNSGSVRLRESFKAQMHAEIQRRLAGADN